MDYSLLFKQCGVDECIPQEVIKNIEEQCRNCDSDELNNIYNYALANISNPEVLLGIVKLSNDLQDENRLSLLIDILVKRIDLGDSEESVNLRVACAKSISHYKSTSSVNALLYCLNNKNENYKLRLACAEALGRIGSSYAVTPLIDLVSDNEEKSTEMIKIDSGLSDYE